MKQTYVEDRLDQLAATYGLSSEARSALESLLHVLADDAAPTTVHDPTRGVDVHIADSLAGLEIPALRDASCVADLGSGAGLPALVLAAARPDASVYAVESVGRKAEFIQAAAQALELPNVEVVAQRVEEWSAGTGVCDVVCARALAKLPVILEYAAPLLARGGAVIAWKGEVPPDELADGAAAAAELGLEAGEIRRVGPFRGADNRYLHVYSKVMETPPRYPRRPGIATKRPLSAKK